MCRGFVALMSTLKGVKAKDSGVGVVVSLENEDVYPTRVTGSLGEKPGEQCILANVCVTVRCDEYRISGPIGRACER